MFACVVLGSTVGCAGYSPEVKAALCAGRALPSESPPDSSVRSSWQYHPGGPSIMLDGSGYPCVAFTSDGPFRPSPSDAGWTNAPAGGFVGFDEPSKVPKTGHRQVKFRYFRSFIYVPDDFELRTLQLVAEGIDDSLHWVLYNSSHPKGTSPSDAGPSDRAVGACQGNGAAAWELAPYVKRGELNTLLLVHSDMQPPYSKLTKVDIRANGRSVDFVPCAP